jgi:hypothetical protein
VIRIGLRHDHQRSFLGRGLQTQALPTILSEDRGTIIAPGIVHEKSAVLPVIRVKRQPEQPALSPQQDSIRDVEKRLILKGALHDDPNRSRLLDDKELPGPIACMGQVERRLKTFSNYWDEIDL